MAADHVSENALLYDIRCMMLYERLWAEGLGSSLAGDKYLAIIETGQPQSQNTVNTYSSE